MGQVRVLQEVHKCLRESGKQVEDKALGAKAACQNDQQASIHPIRCRALLGQRQRIPLHLTGQWLAIAYVYMD